MCAQAAPAPEQQTRRQEASFDYDAFISYTHHDRPVAAGIQKSLHRIGRRVGRLHALRVFRDATDLTASPDLWGKVTDAMDRARYLIVVLSPTAAASGWVNKEVTHWLQDRGPERLLFVVAGGHLTWDQDTGRFDPDRSTAALPVLTEPGALAAEPFYVDVSDDAPWDPRAPMFREKVTDLAAPIHGKPKYELASDDLREQRRFRRLRRAAIVGLVLLTVIAVIAATIAFMQRREAIHQRNQVIARLLVSDARAMLAGSRSGGDVRALQQILAAQRIGSNPDEGALLDALIARGGALEIIETTAPVRVALSPDGQRVVSAGSDDTVRLWDTATGQLVGDPITAHQNEVTSVAFSPDGRYIVSGGGDGTLRLRDADTGQPTGEPLNGHQGQVTGVAFSPDGRRIVSGGMDGTVRRWDAATGQPIGDPMTGHQNSVFVDVKSVYAVAFSPDGQRIVSGGIDGTVRLWDADTGQPAGDPITGHQGLV
ncbi:toll/interleukin-1 receptor domain-containing protein, partial [Nocardia sp. NPDC057663]|uniref:toll/interleukin-1 receptor domain-containing protein n=1 Tax=Nocardia sp. NPDC057663 TaxID=3346201 RepID=UPI00366B0506